MRHLAGGNRNSFFLLGRLGKGNEAFLGGGRKGSAVRRGGREMAFLPPPTSALTAAVLIMEEEEEEEEEGLSTRGIKIILRYLLRRRSYSGYIPLPVFVPPRIRF